MQPETSSDQGPRRSGRPRIDSRQVTGDPTDEILAVAARRFGRLGVAGTTMSSIAADAGLKQSSLYYWFRRKEEIVAALVSRANLGPLSIVRSINSDGGSVPAQLYRFVRDDVIVLCELPFDINEVHAIAARDRETFASYWVDREDLENELASIIKRGVSEGSLRTVDVALAARTILSNDEGVQHWFRHDPAHEPAEAASLMADLVTTGLLQAPGDLAAVHRAVAVLDAASSAHRVTAKPIEVGDGGSRPVR